ncbi:MAG: methylated-DNA--[protein]-cysteine S-methyltransferase [Burkholderiaceae bacterium]|nr:methylated-DNA--[protein]-cysteine S-methyltransferase [Burkholderiaceae bacterium]
MTHPDLIAQGRLDSPLGPLLLGATRKGLAHLWFVDPEYHETNELDAPEDPANAFIAEAIDELQAYWRGRCPARFRVRLDLHGTAFQRAVWHELLKVPPGRTSTYGEVARAVGAPQAARAAGAAIGRNPVAIIVPCHRIIGRDGSLTGFASGLPRKERLLQHEGALLV